MLTLDDDQVLALVRQLPKERKTWLLRALVSDQWPPWAELAEYAGQRVRAVAAARNQDWDRMSDEERDAFIDDIVHEECTIAAQVDAPLFTQEQVAQIAATVKESEPIKHGLPGYNWSIKKLRYWVKQVFDCEVSRRTLCKVLKEHRLSWKKCQKVLKKADRAKRIAYIQEFQAAFALACDGAPCHKAKLVQDAAVALEFAFLPLPGYSPDLNPIEGLWKWMREDVTQNHCYATMRELFDACKAFVDRINTDPLQIISRLWPKFELDPAFEELLVSKWLHFSLHHKSLRAMQ